MPAFAGIDFGNSFCRVSIWQQGQATVIVDEMGNRQVASYVSIAEGGKKVLGDTAKRQATRRLKSTIYDLKVMLGRDFRWAEEAGLTKKWPFPAKAGKAGELVLEPEVQGDAAASAPVAPAKIVQTLFAKLKAMAEDGAGEPVDRAVVSVPVDFDDAQRAALRTAAEAAGLRVMSLLHEPTAAAMAMGLDQAPVAASAEGAESAGGADGAEDEEDEEPEDLTGAARNVLVYDLGGRGVTVTVLSVCGGVLSITSSVREDGVGGDALDEVLFKICCKTFSRKTRGLDVTESKKSAGKLMSACEEARRTLSTAQRAGINVDSLHEGVDYADTITRARYEGDCVPVLQRSLGAVDRAVAAAKLKAEDIDQVVLAGGCARMPAVRRVLRGRFEDDIIMDFGRVNPDEAVALGCASQAAMLSNAEAGAEESKGDGATSSSSGESKEEGAAAQTATKAAVALSIGVETAEGGFYPVIERGSLFPATGLLDLGEAPPAPTTVCLTIIEGQRTLAKDNRAIARIPILLLASEDAEEADGDDDEEEEDGAAEAAEAAAAAAAAEAAKANAAALEVAAGCGMPSVAAGVPLTFVASEGGELRVLANGKEVALIPGSGERWGADQVAAAIEAATAARDQDDATQLVLDGRTALLEYCATEISDASLFDLEDEDKAAIQALRAAALAWLQTDEAPKVDAAASGEEAETVLAERLEQLEGEVGAILAAYEEEGDGEAAEAGEGDGLPDDLDDIDVVVGGGGGGGGGGDDDGMD